MGKFGKMMSRLFRRSRKQKAYVQEEFADFEANQDQCVLNPWQLPLVVHRFDASQDRWVTCSVTIPCSHYIIESPMNNPFSFNLLTPNIRSISFFPSSIATAPFHSSPSLLLVASSSLG
ncbi:hypothetical protein CDAR_37341 [Caerostris darwini]|uniref:Uncharacterized protein n=1 Tax=Caerostris darwini TaxID=1538125 RepID=A0AAV4TNZ8_9ARAC|nr:hypothetical protein CDAR_37341 [Caerostris darwini]